MKYTNVSPGFTQSALYICYMLCHPIWESVLFLLQVKALGCDGSTSLSSWLESLGLGEYLHNFLSSGYRTLDCVKNLWELEIVNVNVLSCWFKLFLSAGMSFVNCDLIHWPYFLCVGVKNWPSWSQKKDHSLDSRATVWGSTFKIQPLFPAQGDKHRPHDIHITKLFSI